ncbi:hypothetical protein B0O99DRAFT_615926 [Bisporella sp. PMI_857]|nr:hypothetical protein B0O99DRAFT_615926 [Bisporella sp. PMI_857]
MSVPHAPFLCLHTSATIGLRLIARLFSVFNFTLLSIPSLKNTVFTVHIHIHQAKSSNQLSKPPNKAFIIKNAMSRFQALIIYLALSIIFTICVSAASNDTFSASTQTPSHSPTRSTSSKPTATGSDSGNLQGGLGVPSAEFAPALLAAMAVVGLGAFIVGL